MSSSRALAPLLVLLLLTACGSDPAPEPADSGVTTDAGSDAGGDTDAGSDAGTPPSLTTQALPDAYVGRQYSTTLVATGGVPPYTFSVTQGSLPQGLALSADGVLSGTPTATGTSTVTVTVRGADAQTASRELTLSVREQPAARLFTVGQWNLTYFGDDERGPANSSSDGGTSDDRQIAIARDIMRDAGASVWGMVEMVDATDFEQLKAQLPGYSGFLSNNTQFITGSTSPYGGTTQKVGVLYDHTLTFQSASLLPTDAGTLADYGQRPPLRVDFTTEIQGVETPLTVIVVHMRAESSTSPTAPREGRQRASADLKAYIDQNLPTRHVVVLGDWNDDVDESIALEPESGTPLPTPYQNLVSDSANYTFITRELSLAGDDTSIGFENVVDHTLVTNELAERYVAGSARVIYADQWVPDFLNTVSDHRPVTSTYALSSRTDPFLRLKSPNGGTYEAGRALPITWTFLGVDTVRVEASTNGGAQWTVLADSVSAQLGSYAWTLPEIDSSNVLVRVVDTANPDRQDTSDAPLTIARGSGRVFINEVLANEPAANNNNAAYEFVEIVNASSFPVDLSGWTLWDTAASTNPVNRRHVFPNGTTLAAGKSLVIVGGAAGLPAGRSNAVVASSNALGLGNDSDSVRLLKADGSVADRHDYSSTVDGVSANRSPDGNPDGTFVLHNTLTTPTRNTSPGVRADGSEF
ncbi:endonuclease [Pyxidicoccus fallax]|uniref:Endonuclease n=1 Tax=Pyxidicoccus fallax TaxID=394095 RepID=A0A848L6H3_9BACT|nr:lamin tail domain-containing protein [Pyxidicoccus fallax]NMO14329.1 endonuclease [Pyxidicoccus fallax]NPC84091.1 endonuclease [Pyxidicoccus fallax]